MRIELTERFSSAKLNEDVAAYGLDPTVYIGVLEADLGIAGIVNGNNRIYEPSEFKQQNEALAKRIKSEPVEAEQGHPWWGSTFDVAATIQGVEVTQDNAKNTAEAHGAFALLDNAIGQNLRTLSRAGIKIGVSSRGSGESETHTINDKSPYWKANQHLDGAVVDLISEFQLVSYDFVRNPSAGTYTDVGESVHLEAERALEALYESGVLQQEKEQGNVPLTLNELKEKHGDLYALAVKDAVEAAKTEGATKLAEAVKTAETEGATKLAEAVKAAKVDGETASPLAELDEAQRDLVLRIMSAVRIDENTPSDSDTTVLDAIKKLESQQASDLITLRDEIKTLRVWRDQRQMTEALEAAAKGDPNATAIREAIQKGIDAGHITTIEGVKADVAAMIAFAVRVNETTSKARGTETDPGDIGVDPGDRSPVPGAKAPGITEDDDFMSAVVKSARRLVGRAN